MTLEYENALSEIYSILKLMPENLLTKIPKSYIANFNNEVPLYEQNMLKETIIMLSLIYRSYLCNYKLAKKLKIDDVIELKKNQMEINKKYKYEKLVLKKWIKNLKMFLYYFIIKI